MVGLWKGEMNTQFALGVILTINENHFIFTTGFILNQ